MPKVHIPGVGVVHFPSDMPSDQIASHAKRLHDDAQGKEAPLSRERRAPGAPSALDAGHHPDSLARERFGTRTRGIKEIIDDPNDILPTDAAFLKRGPEVGATAGMAFGGPLGAGVGAAAGSLAKGQFERGAHVPTGSEAAGAALEGGVASALAGAPGMVARGARAIGPALAKNAGAISKGVSALSGVGAGIASGNPLTGIGMGAATKMLTSPSAIRAAGNAASRVGNTPAHAANKAGFGLLNVKALLEALAEEQP